MIFTAKIPEKIIFKLSTNNKECISNRSWISLPKTNLYQKEIQKNQNKINFVHPFLCQTKKEIKKYENDKHYFVYDNQAVKIKLVGFQNPKQKTYTMPLAQVVLPTDHSVTIEQDVLINSLLDEGIEKGGELPGEYLFASINRKVKLIQVNSGIYKVAKQYNEKSLRKPIISKKLDVGGVYKTNAGNTGVFLGFITTETMIVDIPYRTSSIWFDSVDDVTKTPFVDFGVRFLPQKLAYLWYKGSLTNWKGKKYTETELQEKIINEISNKNLFYINASKSHNFIKKVPGYHLDFPFDVVTKIRNNAIEAAERSLVHSRFSRTNSHTLLMAASIKNRKSLKDSNELNEMDRIRHYDAFAIDHLSSLANMSLFGTGINRSEPFQTFNPWETKTNKFKNKEKK